MSAHPRHRLVLIPLAALIVALVIVLIPVAPASAHALATKPKPTTHPHVASVGNTYSDALVAKKLAALHRTVTPLASSGYVSATNWPVIFVHGFSQTSKDDCGTNWNTAKSSLQNNGWTGPLTTVGYYSADTNCNFGLAGYASYCTNYYAGNQGTNNEDLRHIACELAWYVWDNYTLYGQNVQLVGHSMGGLIIRWALYATPFDPNLPPFLAVQDVVTLSTPHGGIPITGAAFFICLECLQAQEMRTNNAFWQELNNSGQNPQGAYWGTDWTMQGSSCESWYNVFDPGVNWHSALGMNGGHKTEYLNPPCYDHGGYLQDASNNLDLKADWSTNAGSDSVGNTSSTWPHSLRDMRQALSSSSY